jgi:hypothetical protein
MGVGDVVKGRVRLVKVKGRVALVIGWFMVGFSLTRLAMRVRVKLERPENATEPVVGREVRVKAGSNISCS